MNEKYMKQLSYQYPSIRSAVSEIIRLSAKLKLKKGTEHFVSDIHGEFESFQHVLKNASGSVHQKIDEVLSNRLTKKEIKSLATLVYYPEEKIEIIEKEQGDNFKLWCYKTIEYLAAICRDLSLKHTKKTIDTMISKEYRFVIDELILERINDDYRKAYYEEIINTVIKTDSAKEYIIILCHLIQDLAIDRLHVIGDIFDRGMDADKVMEKICEASNVDIEWGNHDLQWMGAACGSLACIASVIRIAIRAENLHTLENAYGINFLPLYNFAIKYYEDDPCLSFVSELENPKYDIVTSKVHKAITILQLKLEAQLSQNHPEFGISNRILLDKIDLKNKTVRINDKDYELLDDKFPTIDFNDPFKLTKEEEEVMEALRKSFVSSEKLQRHIEFLYNHGSVYRVYNGNLLFHGCVPLNSDGSFKEVIVRGESYKGKALFDILDKWIRRARYSKNPAHKQLGLDYMYFMWSSPLSPLYGKEKMVIFEHYFVKDTSIRSEKNNYYYDFYENENIIKNIFDEFNVDFENGHIVNGHVPVKAGTSPLHCNGKVIIIDGGFCKPIHKITGNAGFTLISNSHELKLVSHKPFVSIEDAINKEVDIESSKDYVIKYDNIKLLKDTDEGKEMQELIEDLNELVTCYKDGIIKERN